MILSLASWILGSEHNVRGDRVLVLIGVMVLSAFAGAALGIFIGTSIRPEQIGLMFALIFTPLIFTGCTYYPWGQLDGIKWFQVVTLFNPLTYAAEGLRYAMVPDFKGPFGQTHPFATPALGWPVLGLVVTIVAFFLLGLRTFRRRVVSSPTYPADHHPAAPGTPKSPAPFPLWRMDSSGGRSRSAANVRWPAVSRGDAAWYPVCTPPTDGRGMAERSRPDDDQSLKRLLPRAPQGFLGLVVPGLTFQAELSRELPAVARRADLVWRVALPDGGTGTLHIEL